MFSPLIGLLAGVGAGIAVSVPLGPIGLIIMKRSAEIGLRAGILSGLAVVFIDTVATIAILLGLHESVFYVRHLPSWVPIAGSVVIFLYGFRMVYHNTTAAINDDLPWHQHFLSAAFIALTNPSTYVSFGFIAFFIHRFLGASLFTRVSVATGFFVGSVLWWITLAMIAFTQRHRLNLAGNLSAVVGIIIMFLAILMNIPAPHHHHLVGFL